MTSLKLFGAAALVSVAFATQAFAQAAVQEPGAFAFYYPNADVLGGRRPPAEAMAALPLPSLWAEHHRRPAMPGKCVIVLAPDAAQMAVPVAIPYGLCDVAIDFGPESYGPLRFSGKQSRIARRRAGAYQRDGDSWTGHQQVRGDEIRWEEEKEGQQDLAHAQTTTPFPVSKSAPIESAQSDTRPTMATPDQQTATLDPQERCATQAKRAFEELHANARVGQTPLDKYKSHYYTKTGKCLMLIESRYVDSVATGRVDLHVSASLIDANERRQYAAYEEIRHLNSPAPGGTEPLPRCELTPSLDEEKKCATREEFDAFVNGYLKE